VDWVPSETLWLVFVFKLLKFIKFLAITVPITSENGWKTSQISNYVHSVVYENTNIALFIHSSAFSMISCSCYCLSVHQSACDKFKWIFYEF
jgi:hypothetical protein